MLLNYKMTRSIEWLYEDHPLNTTYFESVSHTNTILNGLNDLRLSGHLFDITFVAEGRYFKVLL